MPSDSRTKRHWDRSNDREKSRHGDDRGGHKRYSKDSHLSSYDDDRSRKYKRSSREEERHRSDDRRDRPRRSPGQSERERYGGDDRHRRHRGNSVEAGKSPLRDDKSKVTKVPKEPPTEFEQPNFALSGKLAEDTNMFNGVKIMYNEPPEAMIPKRSWRLYPFKGDESLPVIYLKKQSAFLLGRDRRVADIPIDHPSCSKQHAVLQFRRITYEREDGTSGKRVKPYVIDLGSANQTFLNNKPIEPQRYYELFEKDVIKFGFSSREYVILPADLAEAETESPKTESK